MWCMFTLMCDKNECGFFLIHNQTRTYAIFFFLFFVFFYLSLPLSTLLSNKKRELNYERKQIVNHRTSIFDVKTFD